jgi:hypothetical protein
VHERVPMGTFTELGYAEEATVRAALASGTFRVCPPSSSKAGRARYVRWWAGEPITSGSVPAPAA